MKITGKCTDVVIINTSEFKQTMKEMIRTVATSGKYEAGETAIVGSGWDAVDAYDNQDLENGVIPKNRCAILEFDRRTIWFTNDSWMFVTDGETHLILKNEIFLTKTPDVHAEVTIEDMNSYTYYGIGS